MSVITRNLQRRACIFYPSAFFLLFFFFFSAFFLLSLLLAGAHGLDGAVAAAVEHDVGVGLALDAGAAAVVLGPLPGGGVGFSTDSAVLGLGLGGQSLILNVAGSDQLADALVKVNLQSTNLRGASISVDASMLVGRAVPGGGEVGVLVAVFGDAPLALPELFAQQVELVQSGSVVVAVRADVFGLDRVAVAAVVVEEVLGRFVVGEEAAGVAVGHDLEEEVGGVAQLADDAVGGSGCGHESRGLREQLHCRLGFWLVFGWLLVGLGYAVA